MQWHAMEWNPMESNGNNTQEGMESNRIECRASDHVRHLERARVLGGGRVGFDERHVVRGEALHEV